MTNDEMKKAAAEAALDYIDNGDVVGVGTGSTARSEEHTSELQSH